jgi:hypothetical protein
MPDVSVQNEGDDSDVAKRFRLSVGVPKLCTTVAATTVYTPATGNAVRLKWVGFSASGGNANEVVATIQWSGASGIIYTWSLPPGAGFAHGVVREGQVGETLLVTLSVTGNVYVNLDVEEFVSDFT